MPTQAAAQHVRAWCARAVSLGLRRAEPSPRLLALGRSSFIRVRGCCRSAKRLEAAFGVWGGRKVG
eukprot:11365583-Alexandrium_andersonii.AAC.1